MNKGYLKVPAEYLWIIPKKMQRALLTELKNRAEVLE